MNTDHAIVEEQGHIMVITLNRPENEMLLSPGMLVTIYEAQESSMKIPTYVALF